MKKYVGDWRKMGRAELLVGSAETKESRPRKHLFDIFRWQRRALTSRTVSPDEVVKGKGRTSSFARKGEKGENPFNVLCTSTAVTLEDSGPQSATV